MFSGSSALFASASSVSRNRPPIDVASGIRAILELTTSPWCASTFSLRKLIMQDVNETFSISALSRCTFPRKESLIPGKANG